MQLKSIHHIAIIASNYEVSKEFYVNILGLPIVRENYRAERDSYKLDLKVGECEIELFSMPNPPKRPNYPEACGLRHLAFCVDDFDATIEELKSKGVKVESPRIDEYTNSRFTFFFDPDGLPLELRE